MSEKLYAGIEHPMPPKDERKGIALCLSGGGYRAALYHLGALRRLNELGVLSQINTICSVSGGSIIAAFLADRLPECELDEFTYKDWDEKIDTPFHDFTTIDIRTWPFLKRFLLPWNWFDRTTQVKTLASIYNKYLTKMKLNQLPIEPNYVLTATDIVFGVSWKFSRNKVGDYQAGNMKQIPDWPVSKAIAASSCFPPVFDPMKLKLKPEDMENGKFKPDDEREKLMSRMRLSDGGVYDNLGLEPVWKTHRTVLVSDGGAPFRSFFSKSPFKLLTRYIDIASSQVGALRKRWLVASYIDDKIDGTYWGIGSATEKYSKSEHDGYSKRLAKKVISGIRTDMDGFTKPEMDVLENHGYFLADAAIKTHAPELIKNQDAPFNVPHPEWMNDKEVCLELEKSSKRYLFGRSNKRYFWMLLTISVVCAWAVLIMFAIRLF